MYFFFCNNIPCIIDYHGDLYSYNVCIGSNKNILLLLSDVEIIQMTTVECRIFIEALYKLHCHFWWNKFPEAATYVA